MNMRIFMRLFWCFAIVKILTIALRPGLVLHSLLKFSQSTPVAWKQILKKLKFQAIRKM